jgi:hypothetical protein
MAIGNFLIMNLLRLITPEEVGEIATKHNGGKFLSLTDLVNERIDRSIYRDFSDVNSMEEIYEEHASFNQAKILPFVNPAVLGNPDQVSENNNKIESKSENQHSGVPTTSSDEAAHGRGEHKDNENMSSFILIEKERLKRSQQILKQKEIFELYQKNSAVDVEQVKNSNRDISLSSKAGVLINKKHY